MKKRISFSKQQLSDNQKILTLSFDPRTQTFIKDMRETFGLPTKGYDLYFNEADVERRDSALEKREIVRFDPTATLKRLLKSLTAEGEAFYYHFCDLFLKKEFPDFPSHLRSAFMIYVLTDSVGFRSGKFQVHDVIKVNKRTRTRSIDVSIFAPLDEDDRKALNCEIERRLPETKTQKFTSHLKRDFELLQERNGSTSRAIALKRLKKAHTLAAEHSERWVANEMQKIKTATSRARKKLKQRQS